MKKEVSGVKKTFIVILCMLMLVVNVSAAETFSGTIVYDGKSYDYTGTKFEIYVNSKLVETPVPPIVLENGRSIVPVREICEALGADVLWAEGRNGKASSVLICKSDKVINLKLDEKTASVNGANYELETAPKLVSYKGIGKTMVPVRFIAENFDMNVKYVEADGKILIIEGEILSTENAYELKYSNKNDKDIVEIKFSAEPKEYSVIKLNSPNRLVVDFKGFNVDGLKESYEAGENILSIRTGYYQGGARIVFDVDEIPEYDILLDKQNKSAKIILKFSGETGEEKEEENEAVIPDDAPMVIIDAGHGGSDPGAIGRDEAGKDVAYEKNINLAVAKLVVKNLQDAGVNAVFTRDSDVYWTLDERTTYANKLEADLFVSIHCNALEDTSYSGTLVMHHTSNEYYPTAQRLASNILKYLPNAWGTKNRGRVNGSSMYVIRKVNMPSVIVENAFITNEEDRQKLCDEEKQKEAAEAIAQGIIDTLNSMK